MGFAGIQLGKVHYMPVGANHEMPIIIRKLVHDNKGMPPPVKDEALFVFSPTARLAEALKKRGVDAQLIEEATREAAA